MSTAELFFAVLAGVFGLVIGSFLNVVVYRVPARISLLRPSRCPRCDAPIRWWQNVPVVSWLALRGRCASCSGGIPARYPLVELGTGVAFAVIAVLLPRSAGAWLPAGTDPTAVPGAVVAVLVAFLWFAASGIALALIDHDTRRLPTPIILTGYGVAVALFTVACLLGADWWALLRAGIGMAALYGFYLLLSLVRAGGMGGGDIRLAGLVGFQLGWLGWGPLTVGAFAAFIFGGVFGIALLATKRAGRTTAMPFGPWIIAGAWFGVLAGARIVQLYGGI